MKIIELTQGKITYIDDEDFLRVSMRAWCFQGNGYAKTASKNLSGKRTSLLLHRFIMGAVRGQFIDHIDGNKLNNHKSNLRFCTLSENQANKKSTNPMGFKGITKESTGKWIAQIMIDGKKIRIGSFLDPHEAHEAYCDKAREIYGDFARFS